MPTPGEQKALLFFATLGCLGGGVRLVGEARRPEVHEASRAALAGQLAAVDSARAQATSRKAGGRRGEGAGRRKGEAPAAPVDLDRATRDEIEALPWIGPTLASRVVANRDSLGPFGSLEALQRVKGIGPSTAKRLAPHVTFSLTPRPANAVSGGQLRPDERPRRRAGRS